jgi:hypothetical protein
MIPIQTERTAIPRIFVPSLAVYSVIPHMIWDTVTRSSTPEAALANHTLSLFPPANVTNHCVHLLCCSSGDSIYKASCPNALEAKKRI